MYLDLLTAGSRLRYVDRRHSPVDSPCASRSSEVQELTGERSAVNFTRPAKSTADALNAMRRPSGHPEYFYMNVSARYYA
ncbi:hypothetical protein UY3_00337 [Chelonia mydas]|uniref:Uncharacterized protein n=1 Tax=Chelonia mydas TaxID=8469 RepID=M7C2L4_CHEMY|nr:hypothetical protein UY3_00337 [Chelonia mydas]